MLRKNRIFQLFSIGLVALALGLAAGCGSVKPVYDYDGMINGNNYPDGTVVYPDADMSSTGSLAGTVWMPGNGPGQVPAGHEIPVYDALVYIANDKPPAMERNVYCEQCVDPPMRYVVTNHKGEFFLDGIFAGTYWLVIQKGHFRLSQQVTLAEEQDLELTATQTTLPSVQDYDNGMEIPNIALAAGIYDSMEDILGKMGIGSVDGNGSFVGTSAAGNFDVYSNGGAIDNVAIAPIESLLENYTTMSQYHIIFIPCSSQTYDFMQSGLAGAPTTVLQNLRQFVADGGKLYVTDWSGEYVDNVFPEQIRFASDHDTPATAWNGSTWNASLFGDADGSPSYTSEHALALDDDLAQWLHGQYGPIVEGFGYGEGTFDASAFEVEGNWDHIEELVTVQLGVDGEGMPIVDRPRSFIIGDENGVPNTCVNSSCKPLTVTFEPVGCGRVLYSTYHTTASEHTGLVPQERVLAYLIMEIGICKSGPIVY